MRHVFQLDDGTLIAVDAKASTAHLSSDRGETWERIYGKEEEMEEQRPADDVGEDTSSSAATTVSATPADDGTKEAATPDADEPKDEPSE